MKLMAQLLSLVFFIGVILGVLAVINVGTFESWLVLFFCLSGASFFWQLQTKVSNSKRVFVKTKPNPVIRQANRVIDFFASIFVVLLLVFVLRSFFIEPFRIPSGSMIPSLHVGDFVLVNKLSYGVRLPVTGWHLFGTKNMRRGDIAVFRFPDDRSTDYIKRIIALPGDRVTIDNKQIMINNQPIDVKLLGTYQGSQQSFVGAVADEYTESIGDKSYPVVWFKNNFLAQQRTSFQVPEGHYFVMGDNRNNSNDSRFWGFVPENHLKGRAFLVWLNWHDKLNFSRFGVRL